MGLEKVTGTKVLGGIVGLALVVGLASDGTPDNDAWGGGEAKSAAEGRADRDGAGDATADAWSVPAREEGALPACNRTAPFAAGERSVRLPTSGTVLPLATPDCGLAVGRGGEEAVRQLQQALVACNGRSLTVDGRFGPGTRDAVRALQQEHGIAVDGVYGPETRDVMSWPATAPGTDGAAPSCVPSPERPGG